MSEIVSTTQQPRVVSSSVSASSPHTRTGEWIMAKISTKNLCDVCLLQKKRVPRSTPLFSQLSRRMPTDTRPRRPACAYKETKQERDGRIQCRRLHRIEYNTSLDDAACLFQKKWLVGPCPALIDCYVFYWLHAVIILL